MKRIFIVLLISVFTFSCSNEGISIPQDLTGVWEQTNVTSTSTNIYRLVFGPDHSGLRINTTIYETGEQTSSSDAFTWTINSNTITLLDNKKSQNIYLVNSEGDLFLSDDADLHLDKVSNDYLRYY